MPRNTSYSAFSLIELSIVVLIIGILLAGVTQGSRLVTAFRVSTAKTLTKSSPVVGITDLAAWWETTSDDSFNSTEAQNNSSLSTWNDINPQAMDRLNLTQNIADFKPIYKTKAINGLPSVYFNGNDGQYFMNSGNPKLNNSKTTIFLVVNNPQDSNGVIYCYCSWISGPLRIAGTLLGDEYNFGSGLSALSTSREIKPVIITYLDNSSTTSIYINSALVNSTSSGIMAEESDNALFLGSYIMENDVNQPFGYYKGDIGEVIVFSKNLEDSERVSVEKYLSQKWNIPLQ